MKYTNYSSKQFVTDEDFVQWVVNPTPESNIFWYNWMDKNPHKKEVVEQSIKIIKSLEPHIHYELSSIEKENMFRRSLYLASQQSKSSFTITKKLAVAASVTILLVCGLLLYHSFVWQTNPQLTASDTHNYVVKSTLKGQKKTIQLPDRSIVKLNSNSTIKFPEAFDSEKREIYLEGEAFFEVVHDSGKPFIVYSNKLRTEVLGTSFNINCFSESPFIQVTVVTGKVLVSNEEMHITLKPYEMAEYSFSEDVIHKKEVDVMKLIAWRDGILVFENEPLGRVFKKLEDWYGVKINVEKDIALAGKYNGEFNNEPLEVVLNGIGFTSNFKYKINENKDVLIY